MSTNPKFMVFHLKELVIITIFIISLIVASIILVVKFTGGNKNTDTNDDKYVAGTYTSSINLNNATAELKITVDKNHINKITLENTSDTVETMYPLINPAIEDIAQKVIDTQSTDHISCSKENLYTYTMLLGEIDKLLLKAAAN